MIHSIPFQYDIIDYICSIIAKESRLKHDFSSFLIVFPNKKPEIHLNCKLSAFVKSPFIPPRIFSIDNFFRYIHLCNQRTEREISSFDAIVILFNILKNTINTKEFHDINISSFYDWGLEIFNFFEELSAENIEPDKIKKSISLFFSAHYDNEGIRENLHNLYEIYLNTLQQKELITIGNIYKNAVSYGLDLLKRYEMVVFAGFFDPTISEINIFSRINQIRGDHAIYIIQEDLKSCCNWFKKIKDQLACETIFIDRDQDPKDKANTKISIYEGFDTHSQVLAIKDILQKDKDDDSLCIVLPEASALTPILYDIVPEIDIKFNISLGYPFYLTPLFKTILKLINMHKNKKLIDHIPHYFFKDYLELLQDCLIRFLTANNNNRDNNINLNDFISDLIAFISDNDLVNIDPDQIADKYYSKLLESININISKDTILQKRDLLISIHNILIKQFENIKNLGEFSDQLYSLLNVIRRQSDLTPYSLFSDSFRIVTDTLCQINEAHLDSASMEFNDMASLLIKILSGCFISLAGTPIAPLQILGVLETRCLSFRNVYIMDFNERSLPKYKEAEPLIPDGLKKILNIGYRERKIDIYRYYINRLINSSERSFLIYNNSKDSERSRFIEEIIWEYETEGRNLEDKRSISLFTGPVQCEDIIIRKSEKAIAISKSMTYTATKIDTYLKCPLRFYFSYILGLDSVESETGEITHVEVGKLVHSALQYSLELYRNIKNSHVSFDREKYFNDINRNLDCIIKDYFKNKDESSLFLFKTAFNRYFDNFMNKTIYYLEKHSVEIISLEASIEKKLHTGSTTFLIRGKIDRIDKCNSSYCIIDYKTGRIPGKINPDQVQKLQRVSGNSRDEIRSKIDSFQLPIYLFLYDSYPCDAFYMGFRDFDKQCSGIFHKDIKEFYSGNPNDSKMFSSSQKIVNDIYISVLKDLLMEITDPEKPFVQDKSKPYFCSFCPYKSLCC